MSWTHLSDTTPRAKKRHRCYLCGLKIEVGEFHVKSVGVCDGEFSESRMHMACMGKTESWTEDEWENHDASEFRRYELGLTTEHSN